MTLKMRNQQYWKQFLSNNTLANCFCSKWCVSKEFCGSSILKDLHTNTFFCSHFFPYIAADCFFRQNQTNAQSHTLCPPFHFLLYRVLVVMDCASSSCGLCVFPESFIVRPMSLQCHLAGFVRKSDTLKSLHFLRALACKNSGISKE